MQVFDTFMFEMVLKKFITPVRTPSHAQTKHKVNNKGNKTIKTNSLMPTKFLCTSLTVYMCIHINDGQHKLYYKKNVRITHSVFYRFACVIVSCNNTTGFFFPRRMAINFIAASNIFVYNLLDITCYTALILRVTAILTRHRFVWFFCQTKEKSWNCHKMFSSSLVKEWNMKSLKSEVDNNDILCNFTKTCW